MQYSRVLPTELRGQVIANRALYSGIYVYYVKKYHVHFRISHTMNAEDIFRSSIGCEIMLMIKVRIRLIFSRYTKAKVLRNLAICITKAFILRDSLINERR